MKNVILVLCLICISSESFARDRYYGSGVVPYVKSSNRQYEKSWNSQAKYYNIQHNIIISRALTERLKRQNASRDFSSESESTYSYAYVISPEQICVNNIKYDDSKGSNTNVFKMRKQRLKCGEM